MANQKSLSRDTTVFDAVAKFIEKNPECSRNQITEGLKLTHPRTAEAIKYLRSKGLICSTGRGKGVKYTATKM